MQYLNCLFSLHDMFFKVNHLEVIYNKITLCYKMIVLVGDTDKNQCVVQF